jgi:hypothetical protein
MSSTIDKTQKWPARVPLLITGFVSVLFASAIFAHPAIDALVPHGLIVALLVIGVTRLTLGVGCKRQISAS